MYLIYINSPLLRLRLSLQCFIVKRASCVSRHHQINDLQQGSVARTEWIIRPSH